jgi:tetratricopeptide (TPR) repeat protein
MGTIWSKGSTALAIGFGMGSCISVMVAGVLLATRLNLSLAATPSAIPDSTATATQIDVPVITFTATIIPTPSAAELLKEAENHVLEGNPEGAESLLLPVVEIWRSSRDKAYAYKLLGDAEASREHFKLASPYYEKAYFYQPTSDNLFNIAFAEDMSGDLCNAFKHYQELNSWENADGIFDRDFVKSRIKDISCILGTQVP